MQTFWQSVVLHNIEKVMGGKIMHELNFQSATPFVL